jgi:hypothetical protein
MSKRKHVRRIEDDPRFHNRKGPGGTDLDVREAISWFPDLNDAGRAPPLARRRAQARSDRQARA